MNKDHDSPSTSTDNPSPQNTLSDEERWAERMKPYRQQNLTPLRRQQLASFLRLLRKERFEAMQSESIEKSPGRKA